MKKALIIVGMFMFFILFFYIDSLAFSKGDIVYTGIKSYKYELKVSSSLLGSPNMTYVRTTESIGPGRELTFIKSDAYVQFNNICKVKDNENGEVLHERS